MNCELEIRSPEMALQIDAEIERLLSAMLTVSMVTAVMSLQQISWDIQAAKLSCESRGNSPEETEFRLSADTFTKAAHGIVWDSSDPDQSSLNLPLTQNYERENWNVASDGWK